MLFLSRLVFLVVSYRMISRDLTIVDWLTYFWTSVRFDLMVAGYCLIPFVVSSFFLTLLGKSRAAIKTSLRWNLLAAIPLLTAISIMDIQHYEQFRDRFNSIGIEVIRNFHFVFSPLFLVASIVFILLGLSAIKSSLKIRSRELERADWKTWLLILALAVICIRSSFTEHHLDLRNAEVTDSKTLNTLIIPSSYALDQAFRGRR